MLKKFIFRGAALIALASCGGAASAQIAGGRSGSSSMIFVEGDEIWDVIRDFGACYSARNEADALALVSTVPGSREETDTFRRLFSVNNHYCLPEIGALRVHPTLLRGAVAEGFYKRGAPAAANLAWAMPEAGVPARTLTDAVRCYVASNRDGLRTGLLNTRPGSRQEGRAIAALMPGFTQCLPESARRNRFHPTQLRFRLTEALWRMPGAVAGPSPQAR